MGVLRDASHVDGFSILLFTDYFTAHTANGSVRIGLVGSASFDIPAGHAWFDRIAESANEAEAEYYFDELMGAYA